MFFSTLALNTTKRPSVRSHTLPVFLTSCSSNASNKFCSAPVYKSGAVITDQFAVSLGLCSRPCSHFTEGQGRTHRVALDSDPSSITCILGLWMKIKSHLHLTWIPLIWRLQTWVFVDILFIVLLLKFQLYRMTHVVQNRYVTSFTLP